MDKAGNNSLISEMEQTGIVVLNNQHIDIEIKGEKIRIGGTLWICFISR